MAQLARSLPNASALLLRQVSALLAVDERQAARCMAQAVLDESPGDEVGHAAAAMVAAAEQYDELARHHLQAVHHPGFEPWLAGIRFLLACRDQGALLAAEEAAAAAAQVVQDAATLEKWVEVAVRHSCHAAGLSLVQAAAAAGRFEFSQALARWRTWLEALQAALTEAPQAEAAAISFVILPPFARPLSHQGAADWVPQHVRHAIDRCLDVGADRRLSRLLPGFLRRRPTIRIEPMDCQSSAVAGHRSGGLRVVLEGCLDAGSLPHWLGFLRRDANVVVLGLRIPDPGALSSDAVEVLRRHEPIGAADESSRWLLVEFGVKAFCSVPSSGESGALGGMHLDCQLFRFAAKFSAQGRAWSAATLRACLQQNSVPGDSVSNWEPRCDLAWQPWVERIRASRVGVCPPLTDCPTEAIHLALAVDDRLEHVLPVVVESALQFSSRPLQVHVLGRSLRPSVIADWRLLFHGRAGIELFDCGAAEFASSSLLKHTTVSTLDRLLLPALLPQLPRVIYLDVDVLVQDDLTPLWTLDLAGQALAAKPSSSPGTRWGLQMLDHAVSKLPKAEVGRARQWLRRTGRMAFRAFNAGVLVMDLSRMRRDDAVSFTLALVSHLAMNDQDALNTYVRGNYVALDVRWNAAPRQDVIDGAAIIHFVGPLKPWGGSDMLGRREFHRLQNQVMNRFG
jgi:lipopolysaccharide biosynthesis glycosyltransferase